jgi:hypothetical protein
MVGQYWCPLHHVEYGFKVAFDVMELAVEMTLPLCGR